MTSQRLAGDRSLAETLEAKVRIIVGADHVGLALKNEIRDHLLASGYEVDDAGTATPEPVDYPDIAEAVAEDVVAGRHHRGILVCGTGIGMAIAANKVPGIRAAQVSDPYSAERAAKSNDAQIITLGAQTMGVETAKLLVEAFLRSEFAGGRSAPKVAKIVAIEARHVCATGLPGADHADQPPTADVTPATPRTTAKLRS
jgi:ribose 5-phosphate isomerase B